MWKKQQFTANASANANNSQQSVNARKTPVLSQ
jgi:hypothetical protein